MESSTRVRRRLAAAVVSIIVALLSVAAAVVLAVVPTEDPVPAVNRDTLIAERTKPAVQLIEAKYTAKVSFRGSYFTDDGRALQSRAARLIRTGDLGSLSEVIEYVFDRVAADPLRYLEPIGKRYTDSYKMTGGGSGFVADGNGYVVTAKHVVTADDDTKKEFAAEGAKSATKLDADSWISFYHDYYKLNLSSAAERSIRSGVAAFQKQTVTVDMGEPEVAVVLGTTAADGSRAFKNYPADVVYQSGSGAGEDVAVLRIHVDGLLQSLPLASTPARQGDTVYLHAFPGLPDDSVHAKLEPTVTRGLITAIKPNRAGLQLPQHNATASAGASGAAMLNEAGEVVGIEVMGAIDPTNGASIGESYLMPLESVRDALARSGAAPAVSQTTMLYTQALDYYFAHHYSAALGLLNQAKDLFPAHAYAGKYISDSQLAISKGQDVPVDPPLPWTVVALAAVAVLGLAGGVFFYLWARRTPLDGSEGGAPGSVAESDESMMFPSIDDQHVLDSMTTFADDLPSSPASPTITDPDAPAHAADGEAVGATEAGEDSVDAIPDWEPIDYVAGFPDADTTRQTT